MISLFMKLAIPLSILLFGKDLTKQATWFHLPTQYLVALFAILAVAFMTRLISRGFQRILAFLKISSWAMVGLLVLSAFSNSYLLLQHPASIRVHLQHSLEAPSFFSGAGNQFTSQLPFFIFAITAFGGLDTVASLSNRTKDSRRLFPRGLIYSGGVIVLLYLGGILWWSGANDLTLLRQSDQMHLGNLMYGLMESLAKQVGISLQLNPSHQHLLQQFFIRYTAFTLFTAYLGLLSAIIYGPLKSLIQGTPAQLWSTQVKQLNPQAMPVKALQLQGLCLSVSILAITINQQGVGRLFNQLTYMTNVSRALPYFIVALSYPFFMKKQLLSDHDRFIRRPWVNRLLAISVCSCILLAIGFQIYEPLQNGQYLNALTLVLGPLLFGLAAAGLYRRRQTLPLQ